MRFALVALAALAAGACSNLPRPVSSMKEMRAASEQGEINLVPLTAANLPHDANTHPTFPAAFTRGPDFAFDKIGAGDRLQVRIWESGTPTVFTTSGSSDFGQMTVDESVQL